MATIGMAFSAAVPCSMGKTQPLFTPESYHPHRLLRSRSTTRSTSGAKCNAWRLHPTLVFAPGRSSRNQSLLNLRTSRLQVSEIHACGAKEEIGCWRSDRESRVRAVPCFSTSQQIYDTGLTCTP